MNWRIYYGDGSTYSDEDGPPELAPKLDVQIINKCDETPGIDNRGTLRVQQYDFYWWTEEAEWFGGDIFGLWDYMQRPGWKVVLFGRSRSYQRFLQVRQRALSDADFAPYSGGGEA